jgi:hypothetical protein
MRWSRTNTSADVAELMKRNRRHMDKGVRVAKKVLGVPSERVPFVPQAAGPNLLENNFHARSLIVTLLPVSRGSVHGKNVDGGFEFPCLLLSLSDYSIFVHDHRPPCVLWLTFSPYAHMSSCSFSQ